MLSAFTNTKKRPACDLSSSDLQTTKKIRKFMDDPRNSMEDIIQLAAITGNVSDLTVLFADGNIPIDMKCNGETASFHSALSGQLAAVQYLLAKGANHFNTISQRNVIEYAKGNKPHTPVTRYLKSKLGFSPENLMHIKNQFAYIIAHEINVAKARNKHILVVLGETHGNYKNYQIEKIIITTLKEFDVKVLYREVPKNNAQAFSRPISHFAKLKLGMDIVCIDNHPQRGINATVEQRNGVMAFELLKNYAPGMLITGAAHLQGLLHDKLSKHFFHVVPFNLILADENIEAFDAFACNTENNIQVVEEGCSFPEPVVTKWNYEKTNYRLSHALLSTIGSINLMTHNNLLSLIGTYMDPIVKLIDVSTRYLFGPNNTPSQLNTPSSISVDLPSQTFRLNY